MNTTKFFTAVFCFFMLTFRIQTVNAQPIKPKQLLKKVDASVSNIQTVTYKINYSNKFSSNKDTIQRTAVCSLYIDNKDRTKSQFILDTKFSEKYVHYLYDGLQGASVSYHIDSLDTTKKWSIKNDDGIYNRSVHSTLLLDYFGKKNRFKEGRSFWTNLLIKKMEIKETIHLTEPVYLLTIYAKNIKIIPNYMQNAVNKYYIRKSDFLPIAYSFYGEIEGVSEYEYLEIAYLAVNPDIPLEAFKVDTTQKEIQTKLLYKNIQKYGL